MAVDDVGIAMYLWSPVEQVTFPFDATKRDQKTVSTKHNVQ
jgi:hypothetical protein